MRLGAQLAEIPANGAERGGWAARMRGRERVAVGESRLIQPRGVGGVRVLGQYRADVVARLRPVER